jgi:hypothetical protein
MLYLYYLYLFTYIGVHHYFHQIILCRLTVTQWVSLVEQKVIALPEYLSSPLVFIYIYIEKYLCHKWLWLCSICHNHNLVISSCMTYHLVRKLTGWVPLVEQELLVFPPEFIPRFSVEFELLNLYFFVLPFVDHCLSFAFCHLINRFRLLSWYHQTFPTGVGRKVITITHIAFSAIWANHETIINSRSLCSQPQRMWL